MARKKKAETDVIPLAPGIDLVRKPMAERYVPTRMTRGAKMRRRAFVFEYIKSMSVISAYRATGYKGKDRFAQIKGYAMLREPYVQRLLYTILHKMDEKEIVTTREVLMGLKREANFMEEGTTHSARVAAWAHLGRLLGMGSPDSAGSVVLANSGHVMVVPVADSDESWESQAVKSQKLLKATVKSDGTGS